MYCSADFRQIVFLAFAHRKYCCTGKVSFERTRRTGAERQTHFRKTVEDLWQIFMYPQNLLGQNRSRFKERLSRL